MKYLPGEQDGINTVISIAEMYGYGNLINRLKEAWSAKLKKSIPGMCDTAADTASGLICVWCYTNTRTGKKVKK